MNGLKTIVATLAVLGIAHSGFGQAQKPFSPQLVSTTLGIPFDRYATVDRFGRTITFYVSKAGSEKLPLALFILGSGGQSAFQKIGDRVGGGLQNLLLREAKGRLRVAVVEKPGVEFCFQPPHPGGAEGCSQEFLEQHTLDRWSEANEAAIKACKEIEGIDTTHVLVVGHSEGGIVAAKVAADLPNVSHVAVLAGGGPNQLDDLKELMGDGVDEQWKEIRKDPKSVTKFAWGHPYLRWSTFLKTSTTEQLLRGKSQIFMAAGSQDHSVPPSAFMKAKVQLMAHGREFTDLYIEGGDHGFAKPEDQGRPDGFSKVLDAVIAWYFR